MFAIILLNLRTIPLRFWMSLASVTAIAVVVAVLLTFLAYQFVSATLLPIDWLPQAWLALTVLAGTLFGLLASTLAVRKHLRSP